MWLRVPSDCGRGDPLCTRTETSLPSFLNSIFQLLHLLITKGAGKQMGYANVDHGLEMHVLKSLVTTDITLKF